jgi:hypothetical protein
MTDAYKVCFNCNIMLNDENKVKGRNQCKSCRTNKYKEYVKTTLAKQYSENIERKCSSCDILLNSENMVKNRPICKICYNSKCKTYKQMNKAPIAKRNKIYHEANKEQIAEYYKDHYKENKDTYMKNNRKWREENRDIINAKANERFKNDPIARLKRNARTRIWDALKSSRCSLKLIDCDISFLKNWLEYNFTKDMTFENYGSYWHVDHVIPCSLFDLTNETEINNCFRWSNLQPLEAHANMSKHDNLDKKEVIEHYKKVTEFATLHKITLNDFDFTKYF